MCRDNSGNRSLNRSGNRSWSRSGSRSYSRNRSLNRSGSCCVLRIVYVQPSFLSSHVNTVKPGKGCIKSPVVQINSCFGNDDLCICRIGRCYRDAVSCPLGRVDNVSVAILYSPADTCCVLRFYNKGGGSSYLNVFTEWMFRNFILSGNICSRDRSLGSNRCERIRGQNRCLRWCCGIYHRIHGCRSRVNDRSLSRIRNGSSNGDSTLKTAAPIWNKTCKWVCSRSSVCKGFRNYQRWIFCHCSHAQTHNQK